MKKKIATLLTGSLLVAGVGFAAPITDLQQNETSIGYNHYNLDAAGMDVDNDNFYLENGVSDRVILGIERNTLTVPGYHTNFTDVYAHYKLDPNIRLMLGNRNYSDGPNKMFYGVGANANLAPQLDGYASVTSSSMATEWQTGVNYKLNQQAALHLGYKSYKEDGAPRLDGVGFGASYNF